MSADTSTASTPVSNRQSPALPLGWAAGGMRDEATSMATWGIRMHVFAYICSEDIYMHFTIPSQISSPRTSSAIGGVEVRHRPPARCRE